MELQDYLKVLRKRWFTILAVTLLTVAAGALLTLRSPKIYESKAQFFVSTTGSGDVRDLSQGGIFLEKRVGSYAQLVSSPTVLAEVAKQVNGDSADSLASKVKATAPPNTVLIDVTVNDRDPAKAQRIAQGVADQFPKVISDIESVDNKPSAVKVSVVRPPAQSNTPVSPRPSRNLMLAGLLGLLLGLGLAVLRELLDTSVKTSEDVEAFVEEPVIGKIAFDKGASTNPLIVQVDPRSVRAEAFRTLRTNLRFVDAASHPRSIVITSSLAGEGKTTTTANLALTLAASGAKTVVVEGDLRRPRLLDYLGYEGAIGLTDVLIGHADLDDVLQQFDDTQLWVLGAGPIPPNPSELLGSDAMRRLLADLAERFEYVLIDAPPLLPVTDAAVLSQAVDGIALVVGAGVVRREDVERALESLSTVKARVLGVIMNRLPRRTSGYGRYDYAYSYKSQDSRSDRKTRREKQRKSIEKSGQTRRRMGRTPEGVAADAKAADDAPTAERATSERTSGSSVDAATNEKASSQS